MKRKISMFFLTFLSIITLMFLFFSPKTQATELTTDLSYESYSKYLDEGILGEDVSYEMWQNMVTESEELEQMMENSEEFEEVSSFVPYSRFKLQKGDVLITNATTASGITGHAGIAVSESLILHIPNKKMGKTQIMNLTNWNKKYSYGSKWTKIYRHRSRAVANAAGNWANRTYRGSKARYRITSNLATTHETYCSKIVWQAYYYGPSTHQAAGPTRGYCLPYNLPKRIYNLSLRKKY